MIVKFVGCARCGGDGHELDFKRFEMPVVAGQMTFEHWATCPNTGDPILLRTYGPRIEDGSDGRDR